MAAVSPSPCAATAGAADCPRGVRRDLLFQPPQGRDRLPIMRWIGWDSAMALNWLTGRCSTRLGQSLAVAGVTCNRHQPLKQGVFQNPGS